MFSLAAKQLPLQTFASLIPPTPYGAGPSRSRATGGYGFAAALPVCEL